MKKILPFCMVALMFGIIAGGISASIYLKNRSIHQSQKQEPLVKMDNKRYFLISYSSSLKGSNEKIFGNFWFETLTQEFPTKNEIDTILFNNFPRQRKCYQHILITSIYEFKNRQDYLNFIYKLQGDPDPKKQLGCCNIPPKNNPFSIQMSDYGVDSVRSIQLSDRSITTLEAHTMLESHEPAIYLRGASIPPPLDSISCVRATLCWDSSSYSHSFDINELRTAFVGDDVWGWDTTFLRKALDSLKNQWQQAGKGEIFRISVGVNPRLKWYWPKQYIEFQINKIDSFLIKASDKWDENKFWDSILKHPIDTGITRFWFRGHAFKDGDSFFYRNMLSRPSLKYSFQFIDH